MRTPAIPLALLASLLAAAVARAQCPTAPTAVAAFRAGCSQIVSWTATANPATFRVYRNTVNDIATATAIASPAGTARSYTDTSVTSSTTYYYWVRAAVTPGPSCAAGLSPASAPAVGSPITPVAAPANLQASTTCTSATASWSASSSAIDYRVVLESPVGNVLVDTVVTTTSLTQPIATPLLPIMRVTVTPRNACGPGTPASVTITPTTAGYPPTAFAVDNSRTCAATLTWTPDPRHFNGYRIERISTCGSGPPTVMTVAPGSGSFTDGTIPNFNCLCGYTIIAIDPCGSETPVQYPNWVLFDAPLPVPEIGHVTAASGSPAYLGLTPSDSGVIFDADRVYRWRKGVNPDGTGGVPVTASARVSMPDPYTLALNPVLPGDNDLYALDVIKPCGTQTRVGALVVTNRCRADMTGDGVRNVADVFAYLSLWFAGCP
ncbi:MAG: hypothetical protein K2Q20_07425 [Phycisphaerales bacterium]|nr:hypothetical protein [Phycisphaerales bacterium]